MKRLFVLGAIVASLIPQVGAPSFDGTISGTPACILGYTNGDKVPLTNSAWQYTDTNQCEELYPR